MAEWSNAAVLKTAEPETVPGVRIPLLPPLPQCLRIFGLSGKPTKKGSGVQDSEPFKRLGRRSPHARSRISALGALKLLTPRRHSKGEVPSFRPHDRAVESILD